ncbi:MAG: JAB domain-containing protein [Eubacterium sp.]|nr:JAB domain-containing protein [Eubacterium sp.]
MKTKPYRLDKVSIRMVKEPPLYSSTPVRTPDDAIRLIDELLKGYDREVFCIVNFRTDMTPINMNIVSMGTLDASIIHPREVLKSTVLSNAASVMTFHNHPSGNINPSLQDIEATDRLQRIYSIAGIQFLDHIIIGSEDRYFSFRENQVMPINESRFANSIDQLHFEPLSKVMVAEREEQKPSVLQELTDRKAGKEEPNQNKKKRVHGKEDR